MTWHIFRKSSDPINDFSYLDTHINNEDKYKIRSIIIRFTHIYDNVNYMETKINNRNTSVTLVTISVA